MISILAYDVGTTGVKTCLYCLEKGASDGLQLLDQAFEGYSLSLLPGGGAEQDPAEWWEAIVRTTKAVGARNADALKCLVGISFCSQMQSVVLVDENGRHVRAAMSYMDQRSGDIRRKHVGGGPKVAGVGLPFLLESLHHTGVVAASDKDPVWKYLWVKENEPETFARVHKWLDVKETLIARMSGRFVMSRDSAFATLLCDKNLDSPAFSKSMLKKLGISEAHLPEIVLSTDIVGNILPEVARELNLPEGVPVFAGGGDASLIGLGAGCAHPGDTHIYMGTSGWASVVTGKRLVDTSAMVASVVGVQPGLYNYFAELETAGKCLEWVRDHLALDEINIYLEKRDVAAEPATEYATLYDYLAKVIATAEAGSGGVLFAPWLHGNRCPFEDAKVRGLFLNIGLETGKTEMLRAVIEGICYHMRWFLEIIQRKLPIGDSVRFVGGGALSLVTTGILADVIGRPVETVADPQNVGAAGAALLVAVGLGYLPSLYATREWVPVVRVLQPHRHNRAVYDRQYEAFRRLYQANRDIFHLLNGNR